jgi:hypothetical protein
MIGKQLVLTKWGETKLFEKGESVGSASLLFNRDNADLSFVLGCYDSPSLTLHGS